MKKKRNRKKKNENETEKEKKGFQEPTRRFPKQKKTD